MSFIDDTARALEDSAFGTWLREAPIAFPVVEGLHLLSLAVSFGLLLFADLRLIGWLWREVPAARVLRALRPWLLAGFAVTFFTGALLFWASAAGLLANRFFIVKVVLMVLALANAAWFEWRFSEALSSRALRWAGGLSLLLWTGVTVTGRLIPYVARH